MEIESARHLVQRINCKDCNFTICRHSKLTIPLIKLAAVYGCFVQSETTWDELNYARLIVVLSCHQGDAQRKNVIFHDSLINGWSLLS